MQRRWEEQLAGYVAASFRVLSLGNTASQIRPARQQAGHGGDAVLRRQAGDRRRAHGRRAGRLQHAGRPGQRADAAPGAALAGLPAGAPVGRSASATSSTRRRSRPTARPRGAARDSRATSPSTMSTFRYRPRRPARCCDDVSFSVPAGQVVGIVGPSGSGKSTLAKLVQRLYVPESGRVLVDGIDLAMVDPAWLRRQIGVVLQENVLFNRTVRDNIALADPAMPMERVIGGGQARRRARLHPRAAGRLRHHGRRARQHPVGRPAPAHRHRPRAGHQSAHPDLRRGDQRARLRERAHHPGRTCARSPRAAPSSIIAHRLSTVRIADRIITIERGPHRRGRHARRTDARRGGRYATLHRLQAGSMKSDGPSSPSERQPPRRATSSRSCRRRWRSSRRRRRRSAAPSRSTVIVVSCLAAGLGLLRHCRHRRRRAGQDHPERAHQADPAARDRHRSRHPRARRPARQGRRRPDRARSDDRAPPSSAASTGDLAAAQLDAARLRAALAAAVAGFRPPADATAAAGRAASRSARQPEAGTGGQARADRPPEEAEGGRAGDACRDRSKSSRRRCR